MPMHPRRKQRLMIVLSVIVGSSLAAGLLFYAISDHLNLFYAPSEIAEGKAPLGQRIRAGGMVEQGSVKRREDGITVDFVVTDFQARLAVVYSGILPALFAENDGVVVTGMLGEDGIFIADQVLAKHDENYMPTELEDIMKKKHGAPEY